MQIADIINQNKSAQLELKAEYEQKLQNVKNQLIDKYVKELEIKNVEISVLEAIVNK